MRTALLLLLITFACAHAQTYDLICNVNGTDYYKQAMWHIHGKDMTVAYFDTYLYDMRYDCKFRYGKKELKPMHTNNGLIAFPKMGQAQKIVRERPQFDGAIETGIGWPVFRPKNVQYSDITLVGIDPNMYNVSTNHFITQEYAFNYVKFPHAIKENAVNVCSEGWIYYGNAVQQDASSICIPRGNTYERLYSIVTNPNGAQMFLDYGTRESHKAALNGWVLINEYGEFMGFAEQRQDANASSVASNANNTVGNCNTEVVIGKVPSGDLYAFGFESDECIQTTDRATFMRTGKGNYTVVLSKRIGSASLYWIYEPKGLTTDLCEEGSMQGETIKTPFGVMTLSNSTEKKIRQNGCVVAMQVSKGLYLNATEINLFMLPFLQAVYSLNTHCSSINVCGIGVITAEHCLNSGANVQYVLRDRAGNFTWLKAIKTDKKMDYAIFPQLPEHCVQTATAALGETLYLVTKGKGGVKIATITKGDKLDGTNGFETTFEMVSSFGDSGSPIINRKGEYVGTLVAIYKTINKSAMLEAEFIMKEK